jgi:heme/copper-type cytochrome/quinol oxidase subunit 2
MGAVFALFSGWYFWIPKILGLDYNLLYSKAHFWVLFTGVNLTFFPQHFLGLQGMPRRISDYPDAFTGWNFISSIGSIISVAATALFLHIVYLQLVKGKAIFGYPWAVPQLFSDYLRILKDKCAPGLEWALSNPPKPHAFTSLPLQSSGILSLVFLGISNLFTFSNEFICDAPRAWGLYFQDSASPQMEALVELHDNIMYYLVAILFAVGWIQGAIIRNFDSSKSPISNKYLNHGTLIELIWTITPALILVLIAFPSFKLLYLMDEVTDPSLSVLAEGSFLGGPKSHILNKIEDTCVLTIAVQKNHIIKKIPSNRIFHTRVKAASRIGPHNLDVISVIVGSLLGDCYANKRSVEGTRLCYRQSTVHKDYLFWLYNFFFTRGYCSNLEPRKYKRVLKNKGSDDKTHHGYEFNTFTFRSFNWVHKMFYKKGIKYINADLVKYITPLALAIWISDDGGWAKPGVRLAVNSFKLKEVEFLVEVLQSKFGLNCTIQTLKPSGNHNIYIIGSSVPKLRELVLPHLHTSMYYKLGL